MELLPDEFVALINGHLSVAAFLFESHDDGHFGAEPSFAGDRKSVVVHGLLAEKQQAEAEVDGGADEPVLFEFQEQLAAEFVVIRLHTHGQAEASFGQLLNLSPVNMGYLADLVEIAIRFFERRHGVLRGEFARLEIHRRWRS